MNMKNLMIFVLFLGMTNAVLSQEEERTTYKHYLGIHSGLATGLGFSYRYWPGKFGFQVTGIPVFYGSEESSSLFASFGVSGLMNIKDFEKVSIYSYLGNHLIYTKNSYYEYYYDPNTWEYIKSDNKIVHENIDLNVALGVGVKVNFWEVLDFNLQAGYGVLTSFNSKYFQSSISGEAGLYYHF